MRTTVDMRQARRELSRFLTELGPEGDKVLTVVVRKLGAEGRRVLKLNTPVSPGIPRPLGRRRLRQNTRTRTRRIREGGARAFVWYSRRGLRFQQILAVEHGARGARAQEPAARSLDQVAGPGGNRFRGQVLIGLDAATVKAAGLAGLRPRRG